MPRPKTSSFPFSRSARSGEESSASGAGTPEQERVEEWLRWLVADHADRILPVDAAVAEEWGRLNVPNPIPVIDGLVAATARIHGLTLATRNLKDIHRTGVACIDPFTGQDSDNQ